MRKVLQRGAVFALGMALCVQILTGCGQVDDGLGGSGGRGQASGMAADSVEEGSLYMTKDNTGDPMSERVPVLEGR